MSGKIVKAWHRFLQTNYNVFLRNATSVHKERKYEHIEVQQRFEEVERERKNQRLALIEYKKKLKKKEIEEQLKFLKTHEVDFITDKTIQGDMKLRQEIKNIEKYASFEEYFAEMSRFQKEELENKIAGTKQIQSEIIKKLAAGQDKEMIIKLESQLTRLNTDLEEIKKAREAIEVVDQKIEELEPSHILLSGMKKKLVLNAVTYYEFQSRNLEGFVMHPETKKAIETVHHHVEHNLPIRRELLYEVVPELFDNEIADLEEAERDKILSKRPRIQTIEGSTISVVDKHAIDGKRKKKLHFYEELLKQEIDMREFVYKKAGEFVEKHHEFIAQKIDEGFPGTIELLEHIELKALEKLSDEEKAIVEDLNTLRAINNDYTELIKLNKVRVFNKQREMHIPKFIENHPELKEIWIKKWEEIVVNSFDLAESVLLPEAPDEDLESKLDTVLKKQQKVDVDALIKQSQLEYNEKVSSDEPIREISRLNKDEGLIKKLNVLSKAMNEIPEKIQEVPKLQYQQTTLMPEQSEEKRILIDELTKVLFLNNKDPKKYTLEYWAQHFNIQPQTLRNIFNYVSYAIPDVTNESETGRIFRFIYDPSNAEPRVQTADK